VPDNNEAGIWAGLSSGVMVGIGVLVSLWKSGAEGRRERKEAEAATRASDLVRKNLDKKQEDIMDRLEAENRELRQIVKQKDTEIWRLNAIARRADSFAHDMRHMVVNVFQRFGVSDPVPHVPLLEEPLDDDADNTEIGG
jgi:hypothetical protein